MKLIIAVWNRAGKGKSESIRQFAKILTATYPNFIPIYPSPFTVPNDGDFMAVVEIVRNRIGIASQGDPGNGLSGKLHQLTKLGSNVIVCSTRTSGETVNAVLDHARLHDYQVVWTATHEMTNGNNHPTLNVLKGKHLLDLLQCLELAN